MKFIVWMCLLVSSVLIVFLFLCIMLRILVGRLVLRNSLVMCMGIEGLCLFGLRIMVLLVVRVGFVF